MQSEGVYYARIENHGIAKAKTGTPQWWAEITVLGTPIDENDLLKGFTPVEKPFKRTVYEPISLNTVEVLQEKLASIGFKSDDLEDLYPDSPNAHDFVGTECLVQCKHNEYKGKTNEKWNLSRRRAKLELTEQDKDVLRSLFADKFREAANQRMQSA